MDTNFENELILSESLLTEKEKNELLGGKQTNEEFANAENASTLKKVGVYCSKKSGVFC